MRIHLVISQFAIQADLQFTQIIESAKKCVVGQDSVMAIVCDRLLTSTCEYSNWLVNSEGEKSDPSEVCRVCENFTFDTLSVTGIQSVKNLSDVVGHEKAAHVSDENLDLEHYFKANSTIFDIVFNSFATEFKIATDFQFDELSITEISRLRSYIGSAEVLFEGFKRFFAAENIASIHMFNGRFLAYRAALLAARVLKIPTFVYERGQQAKPILMFGESATFQTVSAADKVKNNLFPYNFSESLLLRQNYLINRTVGNTHYAFTQSPREREVEEILTAAGGRKIVSVYTSSDYEYMEFQGMSLDRSGCLFENQKDFLLWISDVCSRSLNIYYVIRIHPNEGRRSQSKRIGESSYTKWIMAEIGYSRPNLRVIHPDENMSSYSILSISSLCMAYGSTIALEASQLGIPSVVVGEAIYRLSGSVKTCSSISELEELATCQRTFSKDELLERGRKAWVVDAALSVFAIWNN
ncbi:MAG: hypothetical protein EOP04_06085, partial [Proteobacteria bacterium]